MNEWLLVIWTTDGRLRHHVTFDFKSKRTMTNLHNYMTISVNCSSNLADHHNRCRHLCQSHHPIRSHPLRFYVFEFSTLSAYCCACDNVNVCRSNWTVGYGRCAAVCSVRPHHRHRPYRRVDCCWAILAGDSWWVNWAIDCNWRAVNWAAQSAPSAFASATMGIRWCSQMSRRTNCSSILGASVLRRTIPFWASAMSVPAECMAIGRCVAMVEICWSYRRHW